MKLRRAAIIANAAASNRERPYVGDCVGELATWGFLLATYWPLVYSCHMLRPSALTYLAIFLGLSGIVSASCLSDGVQSFVANYRICMPDPGMWNGDLVVYALGYAASVLGPAVLPGVQPSSDVVRIFRMVVGAPRHIDMVGRSEDGTVTARSVERLASTYQGRLAACGSIDFAARTVEEAVVKILRYSIFTTNDAEAMRPL